MNVKKQLGEKIKRIRKSKNITSDPFQVLRMSQDDLKKLGEIENCIKFISETIEKIR